MAEAIRWVRVESFAELRTGTKVKEIACSWCGKECETILLNLLEAEDDDGNDALHFEAIPCTAYEPLDEHFFGFDAAMVAAGRVYRAVSDGEPEARQAARPRNIPVRSTSR